MLKKIINHIKVNKNIDLNGYDDAFVREQIEHRILEEEMKSFGDYLARLSYDKQELDMLTERLSNNTSMFFRRPLLYEYLYQVILPQIIKVKKDQDDLSLRVWSAACSQGQEPYTMSILINELFRGSDELNVNIFASDINSDNLESAKLGNYSYESVKNIKYALLRKYFRHTDNHFILNSTAKENVQFSRFDLLDKKHNAPPDSIFGNFDIILCCNVLMYYKREFKDIIFNKLYKDLAVGGYLILGDSEEVPISYREYFRRIVTHENIYIKMN